MMPGDDRKTLFEAGRIVLLLPEDAAAPLPTVGQQPRAPAWISHGDLCALQSVSRPPRHSCDELLHTLVLLGRDDAQELLSLGRGVFKNGDRALALGIPLMAPNLALRAAGVTAALFGSPYGAAATAGDMSGRQVASVPIVRGAPHEGPPALLHGGSYLPVGATSAAGHAMETAGRYARQLNEQPPQHVSTILANAGWDDLKGLYHSLTTGASWQAAAKDYEFHGKGLVANLRQQNLDAQHDLVKVYDHVRHTSDELDKSIQEVHVGPQTDEALQHLSAQVTQSEESNKDLQELLQQFDVLALSAAETQQQLMTLMEHGTTRAKADQAAHHAEAARNVRDQIQNARTAEDSNIRKARVLLKKFDNTFAALVSREVKTALQWLTEMLQTNFGLSVATALLLCGSYYTIYLCRQALRRRVLVKALQVAIRRATAFAEATEARHAALKRVEQSGERAHQPDTDALVAEVESTKVALETALYAVANAARKVSKAEGEARSQEAKHAQNFMLVTMDLSRMAHGALDALSLSEEGRGQGLAELNKAQQEIDAIRKVVERLGAEAAIAEEDRGAAREMLRNIKMPLAPGFSVSCKELSELGGAVTRACMKLSKAVADKDKTPAQKLEAARELYRSVQELTIAENDPWKEEKTRLKNAWISSHTYPVLTNPAVIRWAVPDERAQNIARALRTTVLQGQVLDPRSACAPRTPERTCQRHLTEGRLAEVPNNPKILRALDAPDLLVKAVMHFAESAVLAVRHQEWVHKKTGIIYQDESEMMQAAMAITSQHQIEQGSASKAGAPESLMGAFIASLKMDPAEQTAHLKKIQEEKLEHDVGANLRPEERSITQVLAHKRAAQAGEGRPSRPPNIPELAKTQTFDARRPVTLVVPPSFLLLSRLLAAYVAFTQHDFQATLEEMKPVATEEVPQGAHFASLLPEGSTGPFVPSSSLQRLSTSLVHQLASVVHDMTANQPLTPVEQHALRLMEETAFPVLVVEREALSLAFEQGNERRGQRGEAAWNSQYWEAMLRVVGKEVNLSAREGPRATAAYGVDPEDVENPQLVAPRIHNTLDCLRYIRALYNSRVAMNKQARGNPRVFDPRIRDVVQNSINWACRTVCQDENMRNHFFCTQCPCGPHAEMHEEEAALEIHARDKAYYRGHVSAAVPRFGAATTSALAGCCRALWPGGGDTITAHMMDVLSHTEERNKRFTARLNELRDQVWQVLRGTDAYERINESLLMIEKQLNDSGLADPEVVKFVPVIKDILPSMRRTEPAPEQKQQFLQNVVSSEHEAAKKAWSLVTLYPEDLLEQSIGRVQDLLRDAPGQSQAALQPLFAQITALMRCRYQDFPGWELREYGGATGQMFAAQHLAANPRLSPPEDSERKLRPGEEGAEPLPAAFAFHGLANATRERGSNPLTHDDTLASLRQIGEERARQEKHEENQRQARARTAQAVAEGKGARKSSFDAMFQGNSEPTEWDAAGAEVQRRAAGGAQLAGKGSAPPPGKGAAKGKSRAPPPPPGGTSPEVRQAVAELEALRKGQKTYRQALLHVSAAHDHADEAAAHLAPSTRLTR